MASVSGYCNCLHIQLPLTENSSCGEAGSHACRATSAQFVLVHDPAWNTCIAAVDKFPTAPVFVSCGRACLTWIVFRTPTELFFVTIVLFAGEKGSAVHVLSNIGFESPVLIRA